MGFDVSMWAMLGFVFAAYAVVGNDSLQTLGAFINSNQRLHWFWLFLFSATILILVFTYGWVVNEGDPSWGRLANVKKYPVFEPQWYHTLPPLALLLLTRLGIPVSTSFMVLTIFATIGGLSSMLQKSLLGYALAFMVGGLLYLLLTNTLEKYFRKHAPGDRAPWGLATIMGAVIGAGIYYLPPMITEAFNLDPVAYSINTALALPVLGFVVDLIATMAVIRFNNHLLGGGLSAFVAAILGAGCYWILPSDLHLNVGIGALGSISLSAIIGLILFATLYLVASNVSSGRVVYWVILQWLTTAYLWGVWLMQDFANIFVFLPRQLSAAEGIGALAVITALLAYTFWNRGGPVQKILQSKTSVDDIRSATVINFVYASLLFFFKEVSDIPMSTTWVFLGLIAGREYAFALTMRAVNLVSTFKMTLSDVAKAYIGLVISIDLARGLPALSKAIGGEIAMGDIWRDMAPAAATANFICSANLLLIPVFFFLITKSKLSMTILAPLFALAAWAFFTFPIA